MNPQIRVLLWVGLGFLLYLNAQAWMKHYSPVVQETPAARSTAATPAVSPADGLSAELPKVSGEAAPAAAAPATSVPDSVPGQVAGDRQGPHPHRTCSTSTRASPAPSSSARTSCSTRSTRTTRIRPVRLFSTDSPDTQFLFQSGLTTGENGRSEPNHKAIFTSAAADYRLADGADVLEVPFAWSDGAGLAVTKTFVFRRGSYRVELRYQVTNGGDAPVKLASYAQFLRHSLGNERSMWDPETYAFRGPAYFDGKAYQKLDIEDSDDQALSAVSHRRLGRGDAASLRRGDRAGGEAGLSI